MGYLNCIHHIPLTDKDVDFDSVTLPTFIEQVYFPPCDSRSGENCIRLVNEEVMMVLGP